LLAAPHFQAVVSAQAPLLKGVAYLLFIFAALLSIYFNRSRVLFSTCLMLLALFVGADGPVTTDPNTVSVLAIAGVLIPLNFALMSVLRERGILSLQATALYGLLILQVAGIAWFRSAYPDVLDQFASIEWSWWPALLATDLPHLFIASISLAGLIMLVRALWTRNAIDSALLALLVAFAIVWIDHSNTLHGPLLFAIVGLILLLAVIQDFYDMAYRDDLTRLNGRRALNEYLLRLGSNYSIAMIDVDHFKKFNDRYGHDTGDQVLKMVGAQLARASGGGKAFRYGGEEFTLVFPGKAQAIVKPHLEALRESIADYPMALRSKARPKRSKDGRKARRAGKKGRDTVSVTVSIGLAQRSPELKLTEDVIKAADQALYKAKRGGRNRLCLD
jgi:diguanylate cyclase (GGDEF)-like protein